MKTAQCVLRHRLAFKEFRLEKPPPKEAARPGGRRDSNPQQPEPQSGALPLSYDHRLWQRQSLKSQCLFANKGLDMPRAVL